MSEKAYAKPLPVPSPEARFFWEKARAHELWLHHFASFPPMRPYAQGHAC